MNLISFMFSFLPSEIKILILGLIAFLAIILVFKIIALVLDAIPFL